MCLHFFDFDLSWSTPTYVWVLKHLDNACIAILITSRLINRKYTLACMMASTDVLFTPWAIGPIDLQHRIVLAPLTRIRADIDSLSPNNLIAEYYEQRATPGGLLITEVSLTR